LAGLRSEKQALELSLYETQQTNAQLELLKQQLETENRELVVKKNNLQGQLFIVM